MSVSNPKRRVALVLTAVLSAISTRELLAQQLPAGRVGKDSVVVVPGSDYAAGDFRRKMLGDNYRDLWTKPIKVPVLDLNSFAGGLKPLKKGGGAQTISLTFVTSDSTEWVFRSVHKRVGVLTEQYQGTVIWDIVRDAGSASHPTAFLAAAPMMEAAGVLHPTGRLAVMPDDPILGEFRKEFAGMLGEIELRPSVPKDAPAFAGASKIISSEELLKEINSDPFDQVDARTMLTARLLDMVMGDNDRHPDQWKWARFGKNDQVPWVPIAEDRDKVFVSYQGTILRLARKALPNLVTFESTYPEPTALFNNATDFDRRLLGGLDRSVWDSVAISLTSALTNSVIDSVLRAMPREYAPSSRVVGEKLKARRDRLHAAADHYYDLLSRVVDIHATDSADKATVTRSGDGLVDVQIRFGNNPPWFSRRFDARETSRIRLYLHGGDDTAFVTGKVRSSIPVRIIGGNGNNVLVDQSTVDGHRNPTRLYDVGNVTDNKYAVDSVDVKKNVDDALNHSFNRRPWLHAYGTLIPPILDRGTSVRPILGANTGRGLGAVGRIGIAHYTYGFRKVPYSSMWKASLAYATTNRFEIATAMDKRFESSDVHIPVEAKATQIEVVQFHGLGNDLPDLHGRFYDLKQTQWSFRPAIGLSLNPESDISLGPIVRYTTTDSVRTRFISTERPYGFPRFKQAGLQLKAHYDTRVVPDTVKPRAVFDIAASGYPGIWDAKTAYESVAGVVTTYITVPVPKRPVIALRGGGKKLFGNFPYFDAAFLGGSSTLRAVHRQQLAGDASVYGNAELRYPIAQFPLILPLDVGALAFADAGRVYVDGDSPGGWHSAVGAGFWVGFVNPGTSLNVMFTNRSDHRIVTSLGFAL
jgi:hypothetical protein